MGVSNLVSGLWNLLYLKNKQMETTEFLHAGTDSHKLKELKIFGVSMVKNGCGRFGDGSKIDCIWRRNKVNQLIFCMLIQIHKN